MYLKIITLDDQAIITDNAIGGTIADLKKLRNIIADKLSKAEPGQTFNIDKDYGEDNTVTAKFFVMAADFDPVSMDELIISGRQKIVNQKHSKWQRTKERLLLTWACCKRGGHRNFKRYHFLLPLVLGDR